MRMIRLLVVSSDIDYVEHLSRYIAKKYADEILPNICTNQESFRSLAESQNYDLALVEPQMFNGISMRRIRLPLVLHDATDPEASDGVDMTRINKYQRITSMIREMLELLAKVSPNSEHLDKRAQITAVWSPAGGCGKTTVAMAFAAQRVSSGYKTMILDLEPFSSTPIYFTEEGKGLSAVLEKLDSDVGMLVQGLRQQDSGSGIYYLGRPNNYDDLNILNLEDVRQLIEGCAARVDELVVDLGCDCDQINRMIMEQADEILLVSDGTSTCLMKCSQFYTQSSFYERVQERITMVSNKGAHKSPIDGPRSMSLPQVQSSDPKVVYKTLSAGYFH